MTEFSLQFSEMILGVSAADQMLFERIQEHFRTELSVTRSVSNAFQRALEMDAEIMHKVDDVYRDSDSDSVDEQRSGHDLFRAHMKKQLTALKRAEPTAIDGVDDTGVYQMRVSTRRIRAALKTFAPVLTARDYKHWNTEFKWLAKRLGSVRDLDVFTSWLEQHKSNADKVSRGHLTAYHGDIYGLYGFARQGLLSNFENERYQTLMHEFSAWVEQEQCFFVNNDLTWKSTQELADVLIKRSVRRINRKIKNIDRNSPAEDLHSFRLECKRARYSLKLLDGHSAKNHKTLISKLKTTQRVLGEHQDACERSKRIRHYANGQSAARHGQDFIFFLGTLYAEQQPAIATQAKAFYKLQPTIKNTIVKTLKSLKSAE